MLRRAFGLIVCTALILGMNVSSGSGKASADGKHAALASLEDQVIQLVNAQRAGAGLAPLGNSATLAASARNYAGYMASANFFGHVGPDGSTLVTRNEAAGYKPWSFLGENLAAGQANAQAVIDGWMASPTHRANILSPNPTEIGVGHVVGGSYGHYWVQEFGSRPAAPAPRPNTYAQAPTAPTPAPAPRAQAPARAPAAPKPAPAPKVDDRAAPASRSGRPAPQPVQTIDVFSSARTGYSVSGAWLSTFKALGGIDTLGEPRSAVIVDPVTGRGKVQYFQRAVLEFHSENSGAHQIQRRLLTDILYPGVDVPVRQADAPPGDYTYFPLSAGVQTGLGHFVSNYTRTGQPIYFKDFFDKRGGVDAFGYPMEEPKLENGVWVQRFQAAVLAFHPENDRDGLVPGTNVPYRNYRVQPALLGDQYIASTGWIYARAEGIPHATINLARDALNY